MYIIAVGWLYVVLMMSITEVTIVAGVMTFLLYGLLPVSIILYLGGSRSRRRSRDQHAAPIAPVVPVPQSIAEPVSALDPAEAAAGLPPHHEHTTK